MTRKTLGGVLKQARHELRLTQHELASRVGVKASHIAYLESGKRRPSLPLVKRIANALGLDRRELLFLAHPESKYLVGSVDRHAATKANDSWRKFASNRAVLKRHNVTPSELRLLKQVSLLEPVASPNHFLFILNSIRQAAVPKD